MMYIIPPWRLRAECISPDITETLRAWAPQSMCHTLASCGRCAHHGIPREGGQRERPRAYKYLRCKISIGSTFNISVSADGGYTNTHYGEVRRGGHPEMLPDASSRWAIPEEGCMCARRRDEGCDLAPHDVQNVDRTILGEGCRVNGGVKEARIGGVGRFGIAVLIAQMCFQRFMVMIVKCLYIYVYIRLVYGKGDAMRAGTHFRVRDGIGEFTRKC